ncbi:MAG: hypothetical protein WAT18_14435, partial [Sphingorhabdus sp.]
NCWGRFEEMVTIADRLPDISADARRRLGAATAALSPVAYDKERFEHLLAKRDELLGLAAHLADAKATDEATGAAWA